MITKLIINIEKIKRFNTKFESSKNMIENHIWVTARRQSIAVKEMSTDHIVNCIKCWIGEGFTEIPEDYLGGKEKWLEIFNSELINRQ